MEEKLRNYLEKLFASAPKTKKTIELREELYLNLKERYQDLLKKGATEEEAFEIVKRSVGDVDRLIHEINEPGPADKAEMEKNRRQSAKFKALAVAMYILSPVAIILLGTMGQPIPGLVVMFALIAGATSLLVYNNIMHPKYTKLDDTMVEEFREWKAANAAKQEKKNLYAGIVWPVIVVLYFLISFTTGAWYVTWVIFILGVVVQKLVDAIVNK
jgi:hypothetical protein